MRELLRPVVLLGPPGAGKSAVGRRAATVANLPFFDLDAVVTEREGKSPATLLQEGGEVELRVAELAALRAVLEDRAPALVAAGSGVVTTDQAQAMLRRRARCVLIDVDAAEALRRLAAAEEPRPILGDDREQWHARFTDLEERRRGSWAALCGESIDTTRLSIDEASETLVTLLDESDRPVSAGRGGLSLQGVQLVDAERGPALDAVVAGDAAVLILDDGVPSSDALQSVLDAWSDKPIVRVPGGEEHKTLEAAGALADDLVDLDLSPDGVIVAVGGGAVLDRAGFVASSLYRGVRWSALPTTLLAMVDASVGGKTAVNLARGKNLFGSYWPPRNVLVDPRFVLTVGPRARRAGAAEMLKHAFLVSDAPADGSAATADVTIPAIAAGTASADELRAAVKRSIAIKAGVVSTDPNERGLRRVLNLGHTFGHALERESSLARQGRLLHGEAVAWGLLFALELSVQVAGLHPDVANTLGDRVRSLELPPLPEIELERFLSAMSVDKKRRRTGIAFVCLEAPGHPRIVRDPSRDVVVETLNVVTAKAST